MTVLTKKAKGGLGKKNESHLERNAFFLLSLQLPQQIFLPPHTCSHTAN